MIPKLINFLDFAQLWLVFIAGIYCIFLGLAILVPLQPYNLTYRIVYSLLRIIIPIKFTELQMKDNLSVPEELSLKT